MLWICCVGYPFVIGPLLSVWRINKEFSVLTQLPLRTDVFGANDVYVITEKPLSSSVWNVHLWSRRYVVYFFSRTGRCIIGFHVWVEKKKIAHLNQTLQTAIEKQPSTSHLVNNLPKSPECVPLCYRDMYFWLMGYNHLHRHDPVSQLGHIMGEKDEWRKWCMAPGQQREQSDQNGSWTLV